MPSSITFDEEESDGIWKVAPAPGAAKGAGSDPAGDADDDDTPRSGPSARAGPRSSAAPRPWSSASNPTPRPTASTSGPGRVDHPVPAAALHLAVALFAIWCFAVSISVLIQRRLPWRQAGADLNRWQSMGWSVGLLLLATFAAYALAFVGRARFP